jgi:hypothetical protein
MQSGTDSQGGTNEIEKKTKGEPDSVLPTLLTAMPYSLYLITSILFFLAQNTSVIGLSFVLALGFLLVIMSCALYGYVDVFLLCFNS